MYVIYIPALKEKKRASAIIYMSPRIETFPFVKSCASY